MHRLDTGFGRVLNFCMIDPFTCHLFLYFAPSPENRGHTLSSLWARRVVFPTRASTDWLPLCSHFACISVGFLGKSCADYVFLTVRLRAWISPALQCYSNFAMISDYAIICCADLYFLFMTSMKYYLAKMKHSIISIL